MLKLENSELWWEADFCLRLLPNKFSCSTFAVPFILLFHICMAIVVVFVALSTLHRNCSDCQETRLLLTFHNSPARRERAKSFEGFLISSFQFTNSAEMTFTAGPPGDTCALVCPFLRLHSYLFPLFILLTRSASFTLQEPFFWPAGESEECFSQSTRKKTRRRMTSYFSMQSLSIYN